MTEAMVALGGNLGNVTQTFKAALDVLRSHSAVRGVEAAGVYQSQAMGADAGNGFLNSACVFETSLDPLDLLTLLQTIESDQGRTRELHWGPRCLDLDLVFYGDAVVAHPELSVPHPHAWYRRFVLEPVEELRPDFMHPVIESTVRALNARLSRRPFQLLVDIGSSEADLEAEVALSELVGREFPAVALQCDRQLDESQIADCSLAVCLDGEPSACLHPLCLRVSEEEPIQTLRDILTAACTEVVRLPDLNPGFN